METPTIYNPTDILTPQELAARLKVKPHWAYDQMRPGRKHPIPVIKMGALLRFHWPSVCAWLATLPRPAYKPRRRKRTRKAV